MRLKCPSGFVESSHNQRGGKAVGDMGAADYLRNVDDIWRIYRPKLSQSKPRAPGNTRS